MIESKRQELNADVQSLTATELDDLLKLVTCLANKDYEGYYQCWRAKLETFDVIPDSLLHNECVQRYLAEKQAEQHKNALSGATDRASKEMQSPLLKGNVILSRRATLVKRKGMVQA